MEFLGLLLLSVVVIWAFSANGNPFRSRAGSGAEPFSLVRAFAMTASLLILVGAVMAMTGIGTIIKAGIGYGNLEYSYRPETFYRGPNTATPADATQQERDIARRESERARDLVRGVTLAVVGGIISGAYLAIARAAQTPRLQAMRVTRGVGVAFSTLCALVGLIALAVGLYTALQYFLVPPPPDESRDPFGEPIGYAIAFLPVWLCTIPYVLRAVRRTESEPAQALDATITPHYAPQHEKE